MYNMINKISRTPFKINKALLDYITFDDKHSLLIDIKAKHEFSGKKKEEFKKYQLRKLASFNSKIV